MMNYYEVVMNFIILLVANCFLYRSHISDRWSSTEALLLWYLFFLEILLSINSLLPATEIYEKQILSPSDTFSFNKNDAVGNCYRVWFYNFSW